MLQVNFLTSSFLPVPCLSNLNIFTVWAWMLSRMLWSCDAIEYERYCGLGMDTLVIGRSLR